MTIKKEHAVLFLAEEVGKAEGDFSEQEGVVAISHSKTLQSAL